MSANVISSDQAQANMYVQINNSTQSIAIEIYLLFLLVGVEPHISKKNRLTHVHMDTYNVWNILQHIALLDNNNNI